MAAGTGGLEFDTSALEDQNDFYNSLTDLNGKNVLSEEFLSKQSALQIQDKRETTDLLHAILQDEKTGTQAELSYTELLHTILEKPDQQIIKEKTQAADDSIQVGPCLAGGLFILIFGLYVAVIEKRRKRKVQMYDHVDDIG